MSVWNTIFNPGSVRTGKLASIPKRWVKFLTEDGEVVWERDLSETFSFFPVIPGVGSIYVKNKQSYRVISVLIDVDTDFSDVDCDAVVVIMKKEFGDK